MATKKKAAKKKAAKKVDTTKSDANGKTPKSLRVSIPQMQVNQFELTLVGTKPLMVNNKMNVAEELADVYTGTGGKTGSARQVQKVSVDEQYARAFYVMPNSRLKPPNPKGKYGIPTSGINKCLNAAVSACGYTDNRIIGIIQRSFQIHGGPGGLTEIQFDKLVHDARPVAIGSKKTPQMRHRPMFIGWQCTVLIEFNPAILTPESIVNIGMHAGFYIGLCEMRAQKHMGECGGFVCHTGKVRPRNLQ